MNAKAKGYILGSIAAASYGMNPLFALPLYKAGMNPDSVLFFRYLFAIPLLGIMIKARGRTFKIQRKETFPLIIMGLLVALSSLTLFLSYNYMAAGHSVYPVVRLSHHGSSYYGYGFQREADTANYRLHAACTGRNRTAL